jgi:hypothetical protein
VETFSECRPWSAPAGMVLMMLLEDYFLPRKSDMENSSVVKNYPGKWQDQVVVVRAADDLERLLDTLNRGWAPLVIGGVQTFKKKQDILGTNIRNYS